MHLVLLYFDRIKGPNIYLSFPEVQLEQDIINKLMKFFDLDINETFFEIVLINRKRRILNLYFEIPSEWARGKVEMAMLSLIMKIEYDSRLTWSFLIDASHKIISTPNIYKAFYKYDDFRENDIEIDVSYETIKNILFECLGGLIKRMERKS
ncbi:MAG: hypothetical protein ACFFAS_10525 [Promethearchaeota archaeon]